MALVRDLLRQGYRTPILFTVSSTSTDDLLTALLRHNDVLDALEAATQAAGKPLTFTSPNQYLQLIPASITDGGVASYSQPQARPNVNFKLSWAALNDGTVSFQATIDPSTILAGKTIGSLLTVGAQVQSARCGAKIEIYGLPTPTNTPTTTPVPSTNTPTNTTVDPIFCTYSATTGVLVQDSDSALCQPNAISV